ncbi:MAG: TonB-dependent receptor, partial [Bacteroidota bacterium]
MKSIGTLLGAFFMFLTTVVGQSTGRVVGKVFDPEGIAAPYTNVIVFSMADSNMVKGEVTNNDGLYQINNLPEGEYWIQASFVGFADYLTPSFTLAAGETKNMPTINLALPDNDLAQVEVKAQRAMIEVLPTKTVFNVEGSINATGNTALELLRKSPGVVVDNNDNIILAGKDGVQVYIDGKPSYLGSSDLAAFLRSMQSSEIEAIEIITNPSAKYDAAGNAGIINIRLKKDKRLGGNANINLGYQKGIHSKYNGTVTFNYRDKRSNFFGSYTLNDGTWENWIDLYRIQSNTLFDGQSTIINDGAYNGGRLGWDFNINEKSTFGVVVNGSHNNRNSRTFNLTPITDLSTDQLTTVLESRNINDGSRTQVNSNANYAWQNKEGTSWNIDADYGIFRNNNQSEQPNTYYASDEQTVIDQRDYYSEAPTNIDIYAFKVDHERKLAGGSFSAGIKTSYVKTDNTFDFYDIVNGSQVLDINRSNNFVFDENINAAYASYTRQVNKWTINVGLRAEQTNSKGTLTAMKETDNAEVDRHYFDLFPSGGLTYQAHQMHQLRLNYSRRIDRPNYQDLNPFEFQLSELSFQRGNPFLQ